MSGGRQQLLVVRRKNRPDCSWTMWGTWWLRRCSALAGFSLLVAAGFPPRRSSPRRQPSVRVAGGMDERMGWGIDRAGQGGWMGGDTIIYAYISIYLSIYLHKDIHIHTSLYICTSVHKYISTSLSLWLYVLCLYLYISISLYLYIFISLYLYIFISLCLYVSLSLSVCVHMHTCKGHREREGERERET